MSKISKLFLVLLSAILCGSLLIGTVSASVDTSYEEQELIDRLEQADGSIPADFTLNDMNVFLATADSDTINKVMKNIIGHAIPVPLAEENLNSKQNGQRSNQYRSYNFATKSEQVLRFSTSDDNLIPHESDGTPLGQATPATRAYPDYWFEKSPQSYYDTRTNAMLMIKTKDGKVYWGSGFMISEDTLVTAAHNIYDSNNFNGWCDYIIINPSAGENGNPYGYATSTTVNIGNYPFTDYRGDDWAVAKMDNSFSIGGLGMISNTSNEKGRNVRVQGYPSHLDSSGYPTDLPTAHTNYNLFLSTGTITKDNSAYLKQTNAKAYKAMSGGPVMYKNSNDIWVAGGIISGKNSDGSISFCAFDNNLYNQIRSFI